MTYLQLERLIKQPIFTLVDVLRNFPDDSEQTVRVQLSRFGQRGLVKLFKRGLYSFSDRPVDELELANRLYAPSYVSLETALNYHGIIPDVPLAVTSVTTVTTKTIKAGGGTFYYHKILPKHFWGFSEGPFRLAFAGKALWDYKYLYGEKAVAALRIDWNKIDKKKLVEFDQYYR